MLQLVQDERQKTRCNPGLLVLQRCGSSFCAAVCFHRVRSMISMAHFGLQTAFGMPKSKASPVGAANKATRQPRASNAKSAPSQPAVLKQYRKGPGGQISLSVGLTGARVGDILRGVENPSGGDVVNVVLRVVSGVAIAAPAIIRRSAEAEFGREALIEAVAKHFGISKAAAELRYDDSPTCDLPNHQPLGSHCSHGVDDNCSCSCASFIIVSQGVWQSFAEQHGNGGELQRLRPN